MKIAFITTTILLMATVSLAQAISVHQTAALLKTNQAILIDTRNPPAYAKAWIPGSINIPLSFIKTKEWLQGKNVILVNGGFVTSEQQRTARALNKQGFALTILDGGLAAWHHAGLKIVGDVFTIKDLNQVKASEAILEKDNPRYLFIDATSLPKTTVRETFPTALRLKKIADLDKICRTQQKTTPAPYGALLLITAGPPSRKILQKYTAASPVPVFYLQKGLADLHKFQKNQQALQQPLAQRLKTIGGCPICPSPAETK